ncbi:MAG: hypothetical protein LBF97_02790 [Elusimicrobiota bacterium]|jgi:phage tail sheath gpL-like|nr:hypothetical protein [Elusimicrobiota bacterium]
MDVSFEQIPSNIIASKVAIEVNAKNSSLGSSIIPEKILIIGQYDNSKVVENYKPFEVVGGLQEVKNRYGYGSMLAIMAEKVFANAGTTIPVYISAVPDSSSGVKASGSIEMTGTITKAGVYYFYFAGQRVAVSVTKNMTATEQAAAIANAINANLDLPVSAISEDGEVIITAKWKGATGNYITIIQNLLGLEEENASPEGASVVISAMSSGATNPDITNCFDSLGGSTWWTVLVNPYTDTANLTILEENAERLADPLVKRMVNSISATTLGLVEAQNLASSRNSRFNTIVHVANSPSLPFEVASAVAGVVANSAQVDPARPFKNLVLNGILAGESLTYSQIDNSEKKGLAETDIMSDGRVKIYDLVTTYKTNNAGANDDAYRYTVTISNIQAKIYSIDNMFSSEPFVRAKIIDDNMSTSQSYAVSPKIVKGYILSLIDDLWIANAWSKNRDTIKDSIQVNINSANPSRIDISFVDIIVLGERIIAVNYGFAFMPAN